MVFPFYPQSYNSTLTCDFRQIFGYVPTLSVKKTSMQDAFPFFFLFPLLVCSTKVQNSLFQPVTKLKTGQALLREHNSNPMFSNTRVCKQCRKIALLLMQKNKTQHVQQQFDIFLQFLFFILTMILLHYAPSLNR